MRLETKFDIGDLIEYTECCPEPNGWSVDIECIFTIDSISIGTDELDEPVIIYSGYGDGGIKYSCKESQARKRMTKAEKAASLIQNEFSYVLCGSKEEQKVIAGLIEIIYEEES